MERNDSSDSNGNSTDQVQSIVKQGQRESIQSGVTTIGEISTVPGSQRWYQQSKTQTVLFQEVLGLGSEIVSDRLQMAQQHLDYRLPKESPLTSAA